MPWEIRRLAERAAPVRSVPIAGLEPLDTRNADDVAAVAAMHATLLAGSPVVRLGADFARRFFYGILVDDGLIVCSVCKRDGRLVGFMSYTARSADLISIGVRRHFRKLAMILLGSVLRSPGLLLEILKVLRFMSQREGMEPPPLAGAGEGISIASDPAHRDYVPPGGTTRLPVRLFDDMIDYFRAAGTRSCFVIVEPGNAVGRRFFEARGGRPEQVTIGGALRIRYVFDPARARA